MSALLIAILLSGAITTAQPQPSDPAVDADIPTSPVELDDMVLFRVRGTSSYPADERARQISARLEEVARNRDIAVDSLHVVEHAGVARIVAAGQPIATFVEADARLEQIRLVELTSVHLDRIKQAIAEHRRVRSPAARRHAAGRALAATLVFGALAAGLFWAGRRADWWLDNRLRPRLHSVEFHSFTVLRAERLGVLLHSVLTLVRAGAAATIVLGYLSYTFSQFPETRRLSGDLLGLVLQPVAVIGKGLISHVPDLFFLAVLGVLCRLTLRIVRLFFENVGRQTIRLEGFDPDWAQPTYNLIRAAVIVSALVIAYPHIPGSGSEAFKGISILLGVVLSLGSSSAISNLIAGYLMTYRRAFKVGDRVTVGSVTGEVIATRIQVTHVRSFTNEEIIIPNSQILTSDVINYSSLARVSGLILHTEVRIGYDVAWQQVERLLIAAADRTPGILASPPPFVRVKKLGDFAVSYELHAYCTDVPVMGALYSGLHRSILDVFNERGVQIMTPAYESDPPTPKIAPSAKARIASP